MKIFFQKIKAKKWEIATLIVIIAIGIFFRSYEFSDWLHFEIDQVYDIDSISNAIQNGPSNLPLLGTNAGGGALRLGPAFYYMEYVSAKIFGNTPPGHAAFVLIFSILSLPLFYLLCKRYFRTEIALGLLAVFSFSLYLILYSRFSWSPNILPPLILFSFYALLRSVSEKEKRKDLWFLLATGAITVCTHIHFNSFIAVPAAALIFLIIKRPRFSLRTWLGAFFIVFLLYSPVITNEIKTKGENTKMFIRNISKDTRAKENIRVSIAEGIRYDVLESFLIISGNDLINESRQGSASQSVCENCPKGTILGIIGFAYFFLGLLGIIYAFFQRPQGDKKDFLIIISSWFLVSLGVFIYLIKGGFTMQPRFALISAPLAFIFLGFIFEPILAKKNSLRQGLFVLVILLLLWSNSLRIRDAFANFRKAGIENFRVEQEDIFPNTNRVTLQQQYAIVDYIRSNSSQNDFPVYLKSDRNEYDATFWYHLNNLGIINYGPINTANLCPEAYYFLIKTNSTPRDMATYFDIVEMKSFGTLNVFHLVPKKEKMDCTEQKVLERHFTDPEIKAAEMLVWNKLFKK